MLKIRMARAGAKKKPYYHIVVADSRNARDGSFIEKVGSYNPMLPRENAERVKLNGERILHWVKNGAQMSDRVAIFVGKAGLAPMPAQKNNPQKAKPKAKAVERAKEKAERDEKAAETPAAVEAPAAEAPAADAPAAE
ncbi:MAG: 30S ribosomal protein S16 [Alphaproteobacteria bacterium]